MIPMRFAPAKSAWLLAMLLPALWWGPAAAGLSELALAAVLLTTTVLFGHTVGLHRGILHGAFRFSPRLHKLFALLFALTGLGGPLTWIRQHALRDHYQSQPEAPETLGFDHGLLTDLWWTLFCMPQADWSQVPLNPAHESDPWLARLDRWFFPIQLAQGALIAGVFGWNAMIVAWCARNALVIVGHWWVGYLAHTMGSRPYRIEGVAEEGRNLALLGVLSFGEGFHNNHHAAPRSARIGRLWWQLDLGWLAICGLEAMGLVWEVRHPRGPSDLLRPGARVARPEPQALSRPTF